MEKPLKKVEKPLKKVEATEEEGGESSESCATLDDGTPCDDGDPCTDNDSQLGGNL